MCGIAGLLDTTLSAEQAERVLNAMLESCAHRGPDYRGTWIQTPVCFGHNRLSIIDLSDAANQPMHYHGLTISYNGEVYNYIELREELEKLGYTFTTHGDTEVILAAYHKWGKNCVNRFIGMWGFALWDSRTQELFCSRDRFGIKPFHYIFQGGRFYFASEMKALKESPLYNNNYNLMQIARGLNLGWTHYMDETYYDVIKALPAAHNLVIKGGNITVERYWDIDFTKTFRGSFEDKKAAFKETFFDSIRMTERRDVTLGVCLSGGLDSSAIASALSQYSGGKELKTFTSFYVGKDEVDERPFIQEVLKKYPNIIPHYISPTEHDVEEHFDRILFHMDIPMPSSSYISQYFVMKLAAENGIKVVLDGQGSDEIMGGYMHSFYRLLADNMRTGNLAAVVRTLSTHRQRQEYSINKSADIIAKSVLAATMSEQQLYAKEFRYNSPWIFPSLSNQQPFALRETGGTRLKQFLYQLIYVTLLPTLLHTEDINSMAFSIESRVPFLDHRLVELCFSLDNDDIIRDAETKYIMRKALRGVLPDAIADRKDKVGFITRGDRTWLRGRLRHLLEGDFRELADVVDTKKIKEVVQAYNNGDNRNSLFLWRLAMLRSWVRAL